MGSIGAVILHIVVLLVVCTESILGIIIQLLARVFMQIGVIMCIWYMRNFALPLWDNNCVNMLHSV